MLKALVLPAATLALLVGAATAGAAPRLPERLFACHILNAQGQTDIVQVQADNVERARIVAAESPVSTASADRPAVRVDVVECIQPVRERFRDKAAREKANAILQ